VPDLKLSLIVAAYIVAVAPILRIAYRESGARASRPDAKPGTPEPRTNAHQCEQRNVSETELAVKRGTEAALSETKPGQQDCGRRHGSVVPAQTAISVEDLPLGKWLVLILEAPGLGS
jgi:hypothetical protein